MKRWLAVAPLVVGCASDPATPGTLLDTGWFTDAEAPGCPHTVLETQPAAGETDWYYRRTVRVVTATTLPEGYDAWLLDDAGRRVDVTPVWSKADGAFDLVPASGRLEPATDYLLVVQDCEGTHETAFTTSALGAPLDLLPGALAGRTYRLDLGGARWVAPQGLGALIAQFLTEPILLGVVYADDERIDLLGAPSQVDDLGGVTQADAPTWDFPIADFSIAEPTFETGADRIALLVQQDGAEAVIPVTDFAVSGTLSPDGTRFGGGALSGIGDTRGFSGALLGSESFICDLAETSFQLSCSPCPDDGEPFCLVIEGQDLAGVLQPGLTLVDRSGVP